MATNQDSAGDLGEPFGTSTIIMIMKLITTDKQEFPVDTAVVIRNFRKGHTCLFPTKSFSMTKARDFEIPPSITEEGKHLLKPECQEVQLNKLKDVSQDLYKRNSMITVTGTVVRVRYLILIIDNCGFLINCKISLVFS